MALTAKLEFRQSQSLVMTPQLMQAIKLLQMSNVDLVSYVEEELERNPLLERDEDRPERGINDDLAGRAEPSVSDEQTRDPGEAGSDGVNGEAVDWIDTTLNSTGVDMEAALDSSLANVFPDEVPAKALDPDQLAGSAWTSATGSGAGGGEAPNFEAMHAAEVSLADHLVEQMMLAIPDASQRLIGRHLIDSLDESGYLRVEMQDVADRLGASIATVEATLGIMQTFEPAGIFARDVKECLALQLRERDRLDPAMQALLDNLDLLVRRDYARLRRLCGVDQEDLADMLEEIRALDPKPGNAFGSVTVQPVVPDVLVRPGPDGGWQIELNAETLPRVLVNQTYYTALPKAGMAETEKQFLSECLQTANWLVKSLDQRARTILKVSSEIVRQQDSFLTHGIEYLRPLNLKVIADAIDMHESTVSRVTSNKYMATPRGIFELKYFFTSAISSTGDGDAHSAEAVRFKIKQLIDAEDPKAILSDDTIVKTLRGAGIDIARRTVAKYREAMGIASSVQRRREKRPD
ncbi:MAG: RNA polymerase factor sigma-54 [Pseudomonadota bacterium]